MPLPTGGRPGGNVPTPEENFVLPSLDDDELPLPTKVQESPLSPLNPPSTSAHRVTSSHPDSRQVSSSQVREQVKNVFDEEEDPFEEIPDDEIDDILSDDDDDDFEEEIDSVVEEEPPAPVKKKQRPRPQLDERESQMEGTVIEPKKDFVDKKKGKLLPFGRSEHKRPSKNKGESDGADPRRDLAKRSPYFKWAIIGLLGALFAASAYRAIVPPDSLSEEEVAAVAQQAIGKTGFPTERGEAFAVNFMKAYLSVQGNDTIGDRLLGYYYRGKMGESSEVHTRSLSNDYRQRVLLGPTVYDVIPLKGGHSITYVVGAVVQPENAKSKAPADGSAAKWTFYSVNVYYDKKTDSVAIDPTSPSVVPAPNVMPGDQMPDPDKIGNGEADSDLRDEISSVVTGFLKGYAVSSAEDHAAIDQYVIPEAPPALLTGLNGRFSFENASDVVYEAYHTDDPNVVKADLKVSWSDRPTSKVSSTYVSSYVMTLQKQENGKYLVTKFAPKYFFAAPE